MGHMVAYIMSSIKQQQSLTKGYIWGAVYIIGIKTLMNSKISLFSSLVLIDLRHCNKVRGYWLPEILMTLIISLWVSTFAFTS